MSPGVVVYRHPWVVAAMRDPLFVLVRLRPASVGKDPRRPGRITVRVAPTTADLWRAGICPPWVFSAEGARSAPTFTRGCVFTQDAPTERQGLMNHIVPYLSGSGLSPCLLGGIAIVWSVYHRFPEPSGGPLPASLSSRPPSGTHRRSGARIKTAHRSSGLDDETYADRRHTRGRNPRGGAGR
jgi:hypothetical protein